MRRCDFRLYPDTAFEMPVHVHVGGSGSSHGESTTLRGRLYRGAAALRDAQLHELCSSWRDLDSWARELRASAGLFALVHRRDGEVYAAVDRARSIPLFYGVRGREAYLSDDANWVRESLGLSEGHEPASTEFLLGGFVTGRETLVPGVKQLPAGDVVRLWDDGAAVHVGTEQWYRYLHTPDARASEAELTERLDAALLRCFERLVDYAGGRTIVVPLSGGYDSRLLLTLLRRLEYPKLIAFSYGRPGNGEAVVSRSVARQLGVDWHFVPYSNEAWRRWFHSEERRAYYRMADGLSVLPLLLDWPAVGELRRRGAVPEDAVFAPGLSGDLHAGSRSRRVPQFYRPEPVPRDVMVTSLLRSAFALWDWSAQERELHPVLARRVEDGLGEYDDFPDGASAFESWDSRERVSKYIVNSVRAYEFWGYDWWIPFWDAEFLDFWTHVPVEWRTGQRLYLPYVDEQFARYATVPVPISGKSWFFPAVKRRVVNTALFPLAREVYRRLRARTEYDRHFMAWFGVVPRDVFRHTPGWNSLASFLTAERLGRLDLSGGASAEARSPVLL